MIATRFAALMLAGALCHAAIAAYVSDGTRAMADRLAADGDHSWPENAVNVVDHIIVDGDFVAVHHRLYGSGDPAGVARVDMWQLDQGRVARHWVVRQPIPAHPVNPAPMGCDAGTTARSSPPRSCQSGDPRQTAHTLAVVNAYLDDGNGPDGHAGAVRRHLAEDFFQHSPHIAQGKAASIAYFAERDGQRKADGWVSTTLKLAADGDLVLLYHRVRSADGKVNRDYVDIFKARGEQVAEHWDVIQDNS